MNPKDLFRYGFNAIGEWLEPTEEEEHIHLFDSEVGYMERPWGLSCACGAMLIKDQHSDLWEAL